MSDMTCPTVKVQSGDSFIVINESDFDPAVHVKFVEPAPLPPPPAPLPPPPGAPDPVANLPANWRDTDAGGLRRLAEVVGGRAVENKKQAVEVIEAELAKRAAK